MLVTYQQHLSRQAHINSSLGGQEDKNLQFKWKVIIPPWPPFDQRRIPGSHGFLMKFSFGFGSFGLGEHKAVNGRECCEEALLWSQLANPNA
jgi:hypothetical protein